MDQTDIQFKREEIFSVLFKELEKNYIIVSIIGVSLLLMWTLMDSLVVSERWSEFLVLRIIAFFSSIALCFTYKRLNINPVWTVFYAALVISLVSMYVTCSINQNQYKIYVLGDMIFFVGVGMLATWSLKYSFALIGITVSFSAFIYSLKSPVPLVEFLSEGAIPIVSVACLSIVMVQMKFKAKYNQIKSRLKLERSLEIIQSKSQENISLQLKLHEFEKSSIMGEITASISHELNTPLSIVVNGTKAIDEIIKKITANLQGIEPEHWQIIQDGLLLILGRNTNLSALKKYERAQSLEELYGQLTSLKLGTLLSQQLVDSGFTNEDREFFEKVSRFSNSNSIFELVVLFKMLDDFTLSVNNAVKTSSKIILELKSIVDQNNPKVDENKLISLYDLLSNVFSLFSQNNSEKFSFSIDFKDNFFLRGNEIRLLQMWFKLIDCIIVNNKSDNKFHVNVRLPLTNTKNTVVFSINQPLASELKENKKNLKDLFRNNIQSDNDINFNILQSLLLENHAKIDILDHGKELEICVKLDKLSIQDN